MLTYLETLTKSGPVSEESSDSQDGITPQSLAPNDFSSAHYIVSNPN